MKIYAVKIPKNLTTIQMERYLSRIPIERQEKVRRFVRKEDAIRSLCGALLIQYILWVQLQTLNYSYSYNKYGKPYINEYPDFHFNLSHSHSWVVCAIDNTDIGIDIERIKEIDLGIAERFFAPIEYADIKRKPLYEQITCFYEYWTMKESFIKSIGKGLSIPLDSFCIKKVNGQYITIDDQSRIYFFKALNLDKNYKLAVCSQKRTVHTDIHYVNFQDLVSNGNIV